MRSKWVLASVAGLLGLSCAATVMGQLPQSQAASQYVISAKAGGVNFVEGKVTVIRKSGTSGYLLQGDEIAVGDRITTGTDGKAEILLNPGSYLRVGPMTSFAFTSTDLEDLKVDLRAGSAIFEVIAADDFKVSVKLPQTSLALTRSGVYRIDVLADGSGRLSVFKGRAFVGADAATEVESGRTATIASGGISVAKFDRDTDDPFDIWSKGRAKELTKLNAKLQRNALANSLLNSFNRRGWNMYNSFGLWVFDPYRRMWCFLPFGYGWSSPYGWGYDYDIWRCRLPRWVYYQPPWNPGSGTTGGGGTPTTPTVNEQRRARMHTPPFRRLENNARTNDDNTVVRRNTEPGEFKTAPSSTPSSPPIIVSPPPATAPIRNAPSTGETKGRPGR